jgi:hypothetical protein
MNYFELIKPTFIENWPKELCSLSIAQVGIKLSIEQAEALGSNISELYECFPEPYFRDVSDIYLTIKEHINKFPNGIFVRLGSRSPKDSLYESTAKCLTVEDIMTRLTACSERIYEDLSMALYYKYKPYIWLRQWKEIPEWAEFRCFMKSRKLIGFSQSNYLHGVVYPEIKEHEESIIHLILEFFDYFKKVSHLDNVIFDVFVTKRIIGNQNLWEIKLLEINPFFEMTDPCLFDWRRPEEFKGQFLYNKIS